MSLAVAAPLREPRFVRWFVAWVPLASIAFALAVMWRPSLWTWAIVADLWFLSFPHVASTFSRSAFRATDRDEHRWILTRLPWLALLGCASVAWAFGAPVLNGIYFFWQTFHYVRQARGMHRALRSAHGEPARDPLGDATLYSVALWALTRRLVQHPSTFLGVEITLPRVHPWVASVLAVVSAALFAAFVLRMVRDALRRSERFAPAPSLFVITQVIVFIVSYVLIESPTIGWLAVNVVHNAQYLLFVHAWNKRRFAREPNDALGALRPLVVPGRGWLFYAVFAAIGAALYSTAALLADATRALWGWTVTYLVLVQAFNVHHYVADQLLWRAPKTRAPTSGAATAPSQ